MFVLVDYENVTDKGLHGLELLKETDTLVIFYSDVCNRLESLRLQKIIETGCNMSVVKLATQGKNGLDFYIAVRVGEIIGSNRAKEPILIVSNDTGFHAVLEYCWNYRKDVIITCGESILECYKHVHTEGVQTEKFTMERAVNIYNDQRVSNQLPPKATIERPSGTRSAKTGQMEADDMLKLCGIEPCAESWDDYSEDDKRRIINKIVAVRQSTEDARIRTLTGRAVLMLHFNKAVNHCTNRVNLITGGRDNQDKIFKIIFPQVLRKWEADWDNYDPNDMPVEDYIAQIVEQLTAGVREAGTEKGESATPNCEE